MKRRVVLTLLVLIAAIAAPAPATAAGHQAIHQVGLRLLSSDVSGVSLELLTSAHGLQPLQVDGRLYHVISVPGYGTTGEAGKPQLPVRSLLLGVPPDAHLPLEMAVLEEGPPTTGVHVQPVPSLGPMLEKTKESGALLGGDMMHVIVENEATYASDALYNAYSHADADGNGHADANIYLYADASGNRHADAYSHADINADLNPHTVGDVDSRSYSNAHGHSHADIDSDVKSYLHVDLHGYSLCETDSHPHANRVADASDAQSVPAAGSQVPQMVSRATQLNPPRWPRRSLANVYSDFTIR